MGCLHSWVDDSATRKLFYRPPDTPWEGGTFFLRIELSEEYPDVAPSIRFLNRLFHPNSMVEFQNWYL